MVPTLPQAGGCKAGCWENFVPSAARLSRRAASAASACVPAQPHCQASGRGRLLAIAAAREAAARAGGDDASLIGEARPRGLSTFEVRG